MKTAIRLSFILAITTVMVGAQQLTIKTALDTSVKETSGLLYLNNTLITHNDSANTNQLFEIDTATGAVTRTVTITNATNTDWEDITQDDTYIYIGDFGNYQGNRTDLKVYRIAIADYLANTSVNADIINFSYSNQTDFTANPFATNFDAESLIHINNKLYIFSKNWVDGNTNIYELPKTPGTHSIAMIDTISAGGLVTGATYNTLASTIFLTGYDFNGAFLIELTGFNSGLFSNGTVTKTNIIVPANFSFQIEAIIAINTNTYYITAEENLPNASGLYSFNVSTLGISNTESDVVSFYPNPASTSITLTQDHRVTKIYAITRQLVKTSTEKAIDVSDLDSGLYIIKIEDTTSQKATTKRLIINR